MLKASKMEQWWKENGNKGECIDREAGGSSSKYIFVHKDSATSIIRHFLFKVGVGSLPTARRYLHKSGATRAQFPFSPISLEKKC